MDNQRRSWRTLSLRMLLLVMLVFGCGLGMIGRESRLARRRAKAAKELSKAASKIDTEYVNLWGATAGAPPPAWQSSLLGESFFQHLTSVEIDQPSELPADGALLGEFCHLRSLETASRVETRLTTTRSRRSYSLYRAVRSPAMVGSPLFPSYRPRSVRASFSDEHAAGLRPLRRLQNVALPGADLSDVGLACLSPRNPLESLDLSYTRITDHGMAHIAQFENLTTLDVSHTWVTDEGLKHLRALPRLETLRLCGLMVSDEGLRTLGQCKSLKDVALQQLAISPEGLAVLADLPNLQTVTVDGVLLKGDHLEELKQSESRDRVHDQIETPSVFWALDRSFAPHGVQYLQWLLEHGADPDARDEVGSVGPIAAFAQEGDVEVVELLFNRGGDLNQLDASRRGALSMAAERGHLAIMQWLIDHGAELNTAESQTPLCNAAAGGQVESARFLLQRGADANLPNHHGDSPLHLGVWHPGVTELLLNAGADPNAVNANGDTPLHVAARNGKHEESVHWLLKCGADVRRKNARGKTAAEIAEEFGNQELAILLRDGAAASEQR